MEESMKYCVYCGAEMLDDAVMCVKCGRMVDGYYANKLLKRKSEENNTTVVNGIIDDDGNIIPMDEEKPINDSEPSNDDSNSDTSMDIYAKLGFGFSFFIPILGAGFTIAALNSKKLSNDGKRLSRAGLVISIIAFLLSIISRILATVGTV